MITPKKLRRDVRVVERGLSESRAQAKALIMSGRVLRGTERLDKPGKVFPVDTELTIEQLPRFVELEPLERVEPLRHELRSLRGAFGFWRLIQYRRPCPASRRDHRRGAHSGRPHDDKVRRRCRVGAGNQRQDEQQSQGTHSQASFGRFGGTVNRTL